MTTAEARAMLEPAPLDRTRASTWVDLGCGSGTFTRALAELLAPGSTIRAVDRDAAAVRSLPHAHAGVHIEPVLADFQHEARIDASVDGILMANSLHFVQDAEAFLGVRPRDLGPSGSLLIVEYDTDRPRPPWVPYPISRARLTSLLDRIGWHNSVLSERASIYGTEPLYALHAARS